LLHDELYVQPVHVAVVVEVQARPAVWHHVAARRQRTNIGAIEHVVIVVVLVARIAHPVAVAVLLARVVDGRAVVADIADAVLVAVLLARIIDPCKSNAVSF
jgi:hypothetical protein